MNLERIWYMMKAIKIAFGLPVVILGIILIAHYFVKNKIKESEFLFKAFRIAKIFLCIAFICFIGIEVAIISYPKHNEKKDDYILVLGAGLANRTTPTEILRGSADACQTTHRSPASCDMKRCPESNRPGDPGGKTPAPAPDPETLDSFPIGNSPADAGK